MGLFRGRSTLKRGRKLWERIMIIIITEIKAMAIGFYLGLFFVLVGGEDVIRCIWR